MRKKHKSMGLHDKLMQKDGAYSKWHKHPLQKIAQWVFLLAVIVGIGYLLVNRMNDPYAQNYGLESSANNGNGPKEPHLFKGEAMYHEQSKFGLEAEEMDVDLDALDKGPDKLHIKLPGERAIVAKKTNMEKRGLGNVTWRGQVEGRSDSNVSLTSKNGFLAGAISIGNELYEIRPGKNNKHVVEKMDPSLFPQESDAHTNVAQDALAGDADIGSGTIANDGEVQIDLLSVYTPQARAGAGGTAQIDALIQSAVDYANVAFMNSQINARYNLVATAEVAYNDSGNLSTDLYWMQSNAAVASLRNQYGADLVSLVVNSGGCGIGWLFNGSASYGFQVTVSGCAVGNLTFAHEHGHNLGMGHDPSVSGGGSYAYSYGHGVSGVFRTVMAYSSACSSGCSRLPYFSNPNVTYAGYPTGIANQRDNARTAAQTIGAVSGFRSNPNNTTIPATPGNVVATGISTSQIRINWADYANDELGFKLERSLDGVNFAQLADIGANVTSYTNSGLTANTMYSYRIRSYNSAGDSGVSNIGSATTLAADTIAPTVSITSPANGAKVSGSRMDITASASDNVGVTSVQFYIDGKLSGSDTSAPYTYRWNVNRKIANGTHAIMAKAYDAAGNSSTATISVIK